MILLVFWLDSNLHSLLSTVRVVRKTCAGRDAEVIEHEEGREVAEFGGANGAADTGACAFGLLDGEEGLADGAGDGHVCWFRGGEEGGWGEG